MTSTMDDEKRTVIVPLGAGNPTPMDLLKEWTGSDSADEVTSQMILKLDDESRTSIELTLPALGLENYRKEAERRRVSDFNAFLLDMIDAGIKSTPRH